MIFYMEVLKEKYTFLAVFHNKGELGYLVNFPDIDECFTYADTIEHGRILAKEALEYCIHGRIEHKEKIPNPCKDNQIGLENDDFIETITADMKIYNENYIDRSNHIPRWLESIAKKNNEKLKEAINYITLEIENDLKEI